MTSETVEQRNNEWANDLLRFHKMSLEGRRSFWVWFHESYNVVPGGKRAFNWTSKARILARLGIGGDGEEEFS